ncbi:hypothetical protein JXZ92_03180 [Mycoplasma sp. CSL10137]|uniref:BC85_0335 family putative methyltransferase n=1 Tax=unclassified Mycoplasma TaxID=2683645 RepID=UPI00197B71B9|nr:MULTISPECIES: hypothetical protein [unclassified Mycoplasma]MBN4083803.1 hypothetical protein [Mycoplasma sp. CSL10137]MBN4084239.1 hypothetical protein [Mycoplasma sp. CSL10166]
MTWTPTNIGLAISAVVVFIIGIVVYVGINIWAKKIRNNFINKSRQETLIKIESLRNDIGTLPFELKDKLKSKTDDLDIEGIINTVYLNKYQDVLVISENDIFPNIAISEKTTAKNYYLINNFDFDKFTKIRDNNPEDVTKPLFLYNNELLDLIVVFKENKNIFDLYKDYFNKLNKDGMLVFNLKKIKNSEINNLINELKTKNIKYEVSYITNKYLFIVK